MAQFELQNSRHPPSYPRSCHHCGHIVRQRNPESDPLPGWPMVAKVIVDHPGLEAFEPFRDLNVKSLLYYQAELDMLRKQLRKMELKDNQNPPVSNGGPLDCAASVADLLDTKCLPEGSRAQLDLITEIRNVLNKYSALSNKALIQYSQITAFQKADPFNVETLRSWIRDEQCGDMSIVGPGSKTWGSFDSERDLVATQKPAIQWQFLRLLWRLVWPKKLDDGQNTLIVPRPIQKVDGLTRWVANEWVPFCEELRRARRKLRDTDFWRTLCQWWKATKEKLHIDGEVSEEQQNTPCSCHVPKLNTFSERRMLVFTSSVATAVACALPIAAISVLSTLHSNAKTLGIIALFTVAFAGGLMYLVGGSSRVEIFTATAA
ncbi:hypothetical protein GLAREA_13053 [Glarea lozoyensis ATCC 20868]|uniref:DUF6594 domain-containing protein n=1 Tax=Glarea lozoyensis (strain ATCC 20868 / MF5171) TaxID=1116229 RepID=S3CXL5_GLAL2|nr:uncharacterized protein GLAREA_13053 [Glarea lozoyensis ATCC 20868]EPE30330.1 hypothetical protein GLAREA_13053 [Glarea lozoyensis ATCC 20868]